MQVSLRRVWSFMRFNCPKLSLSFLRPYSEFARLRKWFAEKDWEMWDKQIEIDVAAGKLDFLIEEARAAKEQNKQTTKALNASYNASIPDPF